MAEGVPSAGAAAKRRIHRAMRRAVEDSKATDASRSWDLLLRVAKARNQASQQLREAAELESTVSVDRAAGAILDVSALEAVEAERIRRPTQDKQQPEREAVANPVRQAHATTPEPRSHGPGMAGQQASQSRLAPAGSRPSTQSEPGRLQGVVCFLSGALSALMLRQPSPPPMPPPPAGRPRELVLNPAFASSSQDSPVRQADRSKVAVEVLRRSRRQSERHVAGRTNPTGVAGAGVRSSSATHVENHMFDRPRDPSTASLSSGRVLWGRARRWKSFSGAMASQKLGLAGVDADRETSGSNAGQGLALPASMPGKPAGAAALRRHHTLTTLGVPGGGAPTGSARRNPLASSAALASKQSKKRLGSKPPCAASSATESDMTAARAVASPESPGTKLMACVTSISVKQRPELAI